MTRWWIAVVIVGAQVVAGLPDGLPGPGRTVPGLDHVIVVVADLEAAAATYQALGFALKPGRPHANGIRNQHVKFPDGSEIELLTAPAAVDDLTTRYRQHLEEAGDGPALAGFYAPDRAALEEALTGARVAFRRSTPLTVLTQPGFEALFFGGRNASPTDRPEHFAHPNSATRLSGLTIAVDDVERVTNAFTRLGGIQSWMQVSGRPPEASVLLREATIEVMSVTGRTVPGRAVVGVTVEVRRPSDVVSRVTSAGVALVHLGGRQWRARVPPQAAHGLAITFVEAR